MINVIPIIIDERGSVKKDIQILAMENENLSKRFSILLPNSLFDKWLYIEFEKEDGTKFVSPRLKVVNGYIQYDLGIDLLDQVGKLTCQVVAKDEHSVIWKSNKFDFKIPSSINATEEVVAENPDILADLYSILIGLEKDINTITGVDGGHLATDEDIKALQTKIDEVNNAINNLDANYATDKDIEELLTKIAEINRTINNLDTNYATLSEEIDNKLDKIDNTDGAFDKVYCVKTTNENDSYNVSQNAIAYTIGVRTANGNLKTNEPVNDVDCANKSYVDNVLTEVDNKLDKVTKTGGINQAYIAGSDGKQTMLNVRANVPDPYTIAQRTSEGRLKVGTPTEDNDATTKTYVDNLISNVGNPNLLINGDFSVNQREFTTTTTPKTYTVDRWKTGNDGNIEVTRNSDGSITLKNISEDTSSSAYFTQRLEKVDVAKLDGKTVTISCCDIDGNIYKTSGLFTKNSGNASPSLTTSFGWFKIMHYTNETSDMTIQLSYGKNITLKWVKLEIGSIATPFTPRPYAEELALCQRYGIQITMIDGNSLCGYTLQSGTQASFNIETPVTMRTRPTITIETLPTVRFAGKDVQVTNVAVAGIGNMRVQLTYDGEFGEAKVVVASFGLKAFLDAEIY